jgi:O-antigen/teichoic acid export membrane protein
MLAGLFGEPFGAAQQAFRLLILAMGIIFVHGIYLKLLVVFDRTRPELWIRAGTATLNVTLNLLWIPRYGIEGAAMATVLVELAVLTSRLLVGRRLGIRVTGGFLLKPLLAAALMAALMLAIGRVAPWWVVLIGGGAFYVVVLAALRGLPRDLLPGSRRLT